MSPGRTQQMLVDVAGIEPATPCLQIQTAKLDGTEPSEMELEGEKGPTKSGLSE